MHRLPPCASSLSCLSCAQSIQISAMWGQLTAAITQGLGWGCVHNCSFSSSDLTFHVPWHRALLPSRRRWHWLWCCCPGSQAAWRPGCRGRSYDRRLGKLQQLSAGPHPAVLLAEPQAPQYRSAVHTHTHTVSLAERLNHRGHACDGTWPQTWMLPPHRDSSSAVAISQAIL